MLIAVTDEFSVHYGTDPLQSCHLATALAPLKGVSQASDKKQGEEWANSSELVDLYSSVLCTPGASRYLNEALESIMYYAPPTPAPSTAVESTVLNGTQEATPTQSNDNRNENVTTAAASAYTQTPFVLGAAGIALAAAL